jgi:hypothetical protein
LSVSETIETHAELDRLGLKPSVVLFNRAIPLSFDSEDISALLGRRRAGKQKRSHLAELAESELVRAEESRKAASRIRRSTHASLIEVAEHSGIDGLDLIHRLTADLAEVDSAGDRDHRRSAQPGSL